MSARTMFRASLQIGELQIPVRLYAAVEDRKIHFRLLHADDHVPVVQKMVDAETGDEVRRDRIQRGLEVEPGQFVAFEDEELDALAPETSRTMSVEAFVATEQVDFAWFDRPYYLGPDGTESNYFAFAQALAKTNKLAIVRWTMRKTRYVGAVRAGPGYLLLVTLRHVGEITIPRGLKADAAEVDPKQLALARQLVSTLADDFDPSLFKDDDRERVRKLVEAKRAGAVIPIAQGRKPSETKDLSDALRRSLRDLKEKRHA